ncbi:FlgO family outer membrane protein [Rheinheimera sp. 4Y26]|uniref:FlgO family outer membrane protein n=1 Tax=Rheinheimera sp. 4Y26 TaxID=2977811 RepID=UPI0021B0A69E|nr:FlgO family outer membrane protein [Rheinheimera sp. 4Y26]MCT6700538.1 FlgO family outer membrane protein [Rheinheimera sp. 4Y26]
MNTAKAALMLSTALFTTACVQLPEQPEQRQQTAVLQPEVAVTPLLYYTERIADRLFKDLKPITPGAIAVVSFTDVKSLAPDPYNLSMNLLGLQLQESMLTVASQLGYQVKELRLASSVKIYADHERMLSRDINELATQQSVRYVIAGTLNQSENYTTVNARLVDIQTNTVIAAASDLVPSSVLGSAEQVQLRQQMLYRNSQ